MLDVAHELSALYGTHSLAGSGIIHPVHVARASDGRLHALRIDEHTPRSDTDWFVLSLCRARADAVLTSAENVRREPRLAHQLSGPWAEALAHYRASVLGKSAPLVCAIVTRTGDLPSDHPVWSDGTQKLLFTVPPSAMTLRARFRDRAEVIEIDDLDLVRAAAWLQQHGRALVSIEAGPRSASALYTGTCAVDELWLTEWESVTPHATLAGALPEDPTLFAGLVRIGSSTRVEHGQRFRFDLWRRAAPASHT